MTETLPQNKNLYAALIKVQSKLRPALHNKENPHFRSKYSDLNGLWDAARELLTANDLCVIQSFDADENGNQYLITVLAHSSGESIQSRCRIVTTKNDAQAFGSAVTYFRRYAFSSIIGLTSEDDDDGNAASAREDKPTGSTNIQAASPTRTTKAPYPSEAQIKRLYAIAKAHGWTQAQVLAELLVAGFKSISELPSSRYEAFCKMLEMGPPKPKQTSLTDPTDDIPF